MERITEGRTITETDLVMFSYFTGDWTFLHTDTEASRSSVFGERVAHGYLTLSVSLGLAIRSGAINPNNFIALRSIENVRFLKPVKIGDTLKVAYSSSRQVGESNRARVTIDARTTNQRDEVVLEFRTMHYENEK